MKIALTGIAGFAGSHLTDRLLAEGHQLTGCLYFGESTDNLAGNVEKLTLFTGDLTNFEFVNQFLSEAQPELVIHLAAITHVQQSWGALGKTYNTNFMGTLNILESVKKLPIKPRVVLISSGEVYGAVDEEKQPLRETFPYNPRSPYGVSKAAAELLARQYHYSDKLDIVIIRPFNHSGPRQLPTFVCSDFAKQIATIEKGHTPQMKVGNLSARRDFTDVRDTVRAYHKLAIEGIAGEAYNVCSQKAYTIQQILDMLLTHSRVSIEVTTERARYRKVDIPLYLGSYEKLNHLTGWKPDIDFKQTMADLLNYWRDK